MSRASLCDRRRLLFPSPGFMAASMVAAFTVAA
jgi:hypothetical protein